MARPPNLRMHMPEPILPISALEWAEEYLWWLARPESITRTAVLEVLLSP